MQSYHLVDVFSHTPFGGNQLAVFPEANGLTDEAMQKLANELHLSETVFVLPAENPSAVARMRIFTPRLELPFAGHPTLGTAHVLARLGRVADEATLEQQAGPVGVRLERIDEERSTVELQVDRAPQFLTDVPDRAVIAATVGLSLDDLSDEAGSIAAASCGVPFLLVRLRDRAALSQVVIDVAAWRRHLASTSAPHLYLYTFDGRESVGVQARMFAPAMGLEEDPATGAAASALAAHLARQAGPGEIDFAVEQGVDMGRPSQLRLRAVHREGRVERIRVAGACVTMGAGQLRVPD